MTLKSKTIVFFGTEDFSLDSLKALVNAGYNIGVVVTKPDSKKGRNQNLTPPAVKIFANEHNIPVWQPTKLDEIVSNIAALDSPVGVLVSYGKIIPQKVIDLFNLGIINVHPSLLPKYRGSSPIESAILNGDTYTGVSIMQLSAEMDAGPVYAQIVHELTGKETQPDLHKTLSGAGAALLVNILPSIIDGSLQPVTQNESEATYTLLLNKKDAWLTPDTVSSKQAEQKVRAHLLFPKTKLNVMGHDIIITKAHVSDNSKTPLDIKCTDGAFLSIDELVAPSGRKMTAISFINGYAAV